ncbi:MAG: S8 family serine peptidase [Thiohalocapsa sp. PB-PSB1]|jgi:subtilisin family serine protease|nr:MAG: S8 family serine peptidase [Thiohalocapsa sp. PB-PSB1]
MKKNRMRSTSAVLLLAALTVTAPRIDAEPIIAGVSINVGVPDLMAVTIVGSGFVDGSTSITFNGLAVPVGEFALLSSARLVALVPTGATSGPLVVSVNGVESDPVDFTISAFVPTPGVDYATDQVVARVIPGASVGRMLEETGLNLTRVVPLTNAYWYQFQIPNGRSIRQVIIDLLATGLVDAAEAAFRAFQNAEVRPSQQNQPQPNDPRFEPKQYGPQRIRAIDQNANVPDGHFIAKGEGITIGIVDTGVDDQHPDLAGKVDLGWDCVNNDAFPTDDQGHGTHVAGIAGAITNNTTGMVGIGANSKLLASKALGSEGGTNEMVASCIVDSVDRGSDVINLSLGGKTPSALIKAAVDYALCNRRVVVVAAGNTNRDPEPHYPAAWSDPILPDGLIAVANSTFQDGINVSSTRGVFVDVAAPGTCIDSTIPTQMANPDPSIDCLGGDYACDASCPAGSNYCCKTGTSMSAPHVSGLAAMMWSWHPELLPTQVECLMEISAIDIMAPGKDVDSGHGRVDAYAAMTSVISLVNRGDARQQADGSFALLPPECNRQPPDCPTFDPGYGQHSSSPEYQKPPGLVPGIGWPDQVVPITTDSAKALIVNTAPETLLMDLETKAKVAFAGNAISDVLLTPDNRYALWIECLGLSCEVVRLEISTLELATIALSGPPVTELTLTPDGTVALIGTYIHLDVIEIDPLAKRIFADDNWIYDPITAVSITPDSNKALVGTAQGVAIARLDAIPITVTELRGTGLPITGISISPDGSRALVGIEDGYTVIDAATETIDVTERTSGTPVDNIAVDSDSTLATYAYIDGIVKIDLAAGGSFTRHVCARSPVTDIDITPDGKYAVVGTEDEDPTASHRVDVCALELASGVVTNVPLDQSGSPGGPIRTGISITPDQPTTRVALGIEAGVAVVAMDGASPGLVGVFTDAAEPVVNTSITPTKVTDIIDGSGGEHYLGVVGNKAGFTYLFRLTDAVQAEDGEYTTGRPLIAATISGDSDKAVIGTVDGTWIIDIGDRDIVDQPIDPDSPQLNALPDDTQPPLNPSGERGKSVSREG